MFQEVKRENKADTCSLVTPFYLMFQVFISLVVKAIHKLTTDMYLAKENHVMVSPKRTIITTVNREESLKEYYDFHLIIIDKY